MLWSYKYFFIVVWIAFFVYWQIKAANTKTTQRIEPAASRIVRVFIFLIAITSLGFLKFKHYSSQEITFARRGLSLAWKDELTE
jgi:hypothetical protein